MAKTCIRCGHVRRESDTGPDYACPACGVVYAKAEAAYAREQAARERAAALAAAQEKARQTLAATRAPQPPGPTDAATDGGANAPPDAKGAAQAKADALLRQFAAERTATRRAPGAWRGMGLAVLVAFCLGFGSAAGMYSTAAKMDKAAAAKCPRP